MFSNPAFIMPAVILGATLIYFLYYAVDKVGLETQTSEAVVTAKDVTEEDRRRLNGDVAGLVQKAGLDRDALLAQVREQVAVAGRGASRGQARPSGAGV